MSEYDDGFDAGILHQCLQEREEDARREHKQRVAAFGAIRRAAEVAREMDRIAEEIRIWSEEKNGGSKHPSFFTWTAKAASVRHAIRAAIRSDKA